jgi:ADP-dependent phosphofructokinase/glucokinase
VRITLTKLLNNFSEKELCDALDNVDKQIEELDNQIARLRITEQMLVSMIRFYNNGRVEE